MSEQATQQAEPQMPDPKEAYDHLFEQVHSQVFFQKLGQAGIAPTTQKEANDLLELAGKLRTVQQDPVAKQAADGEGRFAKASAALDNVLGQNGMDGAVKQAAAQEHDVAVAQAARHFAEDPSIYNAVLSMKAAEAQGIAEQMGIAQPQGASA